MKTRTSDASNGDVVDTCRAQRRVRKQFEEIDAGRLDPQSVFSKISGGKLVKWDVNMAEMEIRWKLETSPRDGT